MSTWWGPTTTTIRGSPTARTPRGNPVPETPAERGLQAREYTAREAATLDWIDAVFDDAEHRNAPGVVLTIDAPEQRERRVEPE